MLLNSKESHHTCWKSLMAKWLQQASQWHEMCCHELEVISLNPSWDELGVLGTSVLSRIWIKIHLFQSLYNLTQGFLWYRGHDFLSLPGATSPRPMTLWVVSGDIYTRNSPPHAHFNISLETQTFQIPSPCLTSRGALNSSLNSKLKLVLNLWCHRKEGRTFYYSLLVSKL